MKFGFSLKMQRGDNKNLGKRMRYYQGNIDLDCINKGQDYKELSKSYVIFICTCDYFNSGLHEYKFENLCIQSPEIKLDDESYKIILNTKGVKDDIDSELLEFLNYVEKSDDEVAQNSNGELVKHIHKRVVEVKNDKSVEVEFMTLLERDREKIEEGIKEGRLKDAENLLKLGVSEEIISKATEVSIDKIKEMKKKLIQ